MKDCYLYSDRGKSGEQWKINVNVDQNFVSVLLQVFTIYHVLTN